MRIAHFSDTHLLSLRGVSPLAFFGKRITGGTNLLFNRAKAYSETVGRALVADINNVGVDHVVVSGDVTNLSLPVEFELVREVLRGLDLPASEVSVVPGNHDCYTIMERWRDSFSRVLAPFITTELPLKDRRYPFVRLRDDVAIVGLSTARPAPPFIAVGTVGQTQLSDARMLLTHPEVSGRFRLVVLHHPPRSAHVRWHNRLTDGEAFLALIEEVGADLVVHGHLHRDLVEMLQGPANTNVPCVGVNSGTFLSPEDSSHRASYNIYEIIQGKFTTSRRAYDLESQQFVDGGSPNPLLSDPC